MNRQTIKQYNQHIIQLVADRLRVKPLRTKMGYKELAQGLNDGGLRSSRNNQWTARSLYRMMQRQGMALHNISRTRNGHFPTP